MSLAFLIALPFLGSVVAALMPSNARNAESTLAGSLSVAAAVWTASLFPQVRDGGVVREQISWLPSFGLDLVVRIDGFAWMFAMMITGIGALVVLYARYYMSPSDPVPRFFSFLLAFMGAMLGVVTSGNLIQLVFFWELTSLFSFLLIGYWHHRRDARRGARMALVVTGGGGLSLLAGVLLLGRIVGSFDLDAVLAARAAIVAHPLYAPMLVLVLLGALTKSAQFPFQFWLPHAMAAPTPVSAYLHSATMVKAGVFLLARLWPVLADTDPWFWIVGGAGLATLVLGAYVAMFQDDLKGLLAYSTVSHLGLITLLLGLNSATAAVAAVFHMLNHATFKASLFMAAGIADHETGTRDLRRLRGLVHAMPITATLALVASAAMAGVPLLNGFLSKEMFFAETVFVQSAPWVEIVLPAVATLAGVFAVVYSLRFGWGISFGPLPDDLPRTPHEPPRWMRVPVDLLVLACLVVGIAPGWSVGPALAAAARPVVGGTLPPYSLAVWHGFTAPLAMSVVAMIGGVLGYRWLRRARAAGLHGTPLVESFDGRRAFERATIVASVGARRLMRALGSRRLQAQLLSMVVATVLAAGAALGFDGLSWGERARVAPSPVFVGLWAVGIVAALAAAAQAKFHRFAAVAMLAVAGVVTCITFLWFSAPDLALTQLAVEVVTTVLFLLGLRWLPKRIVEENRRVALRARTRRVRDLVLAVVVGAATAALSYAMLTREAPQSISPFLLARALPDGGGRNVVNVTLVDFRSFDTMGEIAVLGIVALVVYALLRRFRPPRESIVPDQQMLGIDADPLDDVLAPEPGGDPAIGYRTVPAVLVRLLLPVAFVVALHLFLRGHDAPGGGFVAGLVVAIAFLTQYLVLGTAWVESRVHLRTPWWIATGLLLVVATGAGAIVFGHPFLTTHTAHVPMPWGGEAHWPSALLFDAGVFAVVVGATLLMLIALAHQSLRAHRRTG
ncbi:MAG: monovalent cation/H+ antiporter subunit A [Burkholderiaceae bacterium]|nr:monovalent cation/H+ antiporter subunit A [Burkholderiaceae bacterium]